MNKFITFSIISTYRTDESEELLYTVRSLVMVRNQLPAQVVKIHGKKKNAKLYRGFQKFSKRT